MIDVLIGFMVGIGKNSTGRGVGILNVKLNLSGSDDFRTDIRLDVSKLSASSIGLLKYLLLSGIIIVQDGLISINPTPLIV